MRWQENVLRGWLGVNADGLWAAGTCGLSVPRQNGKTLGVTEARSNYGMLVKNELVLYTSHLQKTSTETFEDMANFFDSRRLRKYVKTIRTALGREAIILKSGAQIKFLARTRNGGRGQHCDLLIFDEAQELTDEQQASFLPTQAASANPQTIYTGTPPDENAPGSVFRRIRDKASSGADGMAWAEWSVDQVGDVTDRQRWYRTNPSLGLLILESSVEKEANDMAPDKFARERLGWWMPAGSQIDHVIDKAIWDQRRVDEPPEPHLVCAGVKFGTDRATLAYCIRPKTGSCYIEWVDTRSLNEGVGWLAQWLDTRRNTIATVAIDGRSGTGALTTRLHDMGFPKPAVILPGSSDMATANAMLPDAVNTGTLTHYGQDELTMSATMSARRRIGGDGFGFEDHDTADSTLIEACALAHWQARTTKRNPKRKLRVG